MKGKSEHRHADEVRTREDVDKSAGDNPQLV